jgi:TPR repeat protein
MSEHVVNGSSPQAQFEEGVHWYVQGCVSQNRLHAVELFRAGTAAGYAVATAWLARCYWHGNGVEKDRTEAHRLTKVALDEQGLRVLAEQGDPAAQYALGGMCSTGRGVDRDDCKAVVWWRKAAEQGHADSQCQLGFTYRDGKRVDQNLATALGWFQKAAVQGVAAAQGALGDQYRRGKGWFKGGVDHNECQAVQWLRKAAEQGEEAAQRMLREWDTTLADVATKWQVVYDPDPRATVIEADKAQHWTRGSSAEDEQEEEAYEGESQEDRGMLRQMSPWVVCCELNADALMNKAVDVGDLRGMAEEACRKYGSAISVVTSSEGYFTEPDEIYCMKLRARLLASSEPDTTGLAKKHGADDGNVGELTVCCPDGTSHKLAASPSTTVLEVKQHVRRAVQGGGAADAASTEEHSALPFFWQDEHAVQRQHIFVHGVEDELEDTRSMGSLGSPSALFLMVDTEEAFMERLEAEAAALRGQLEGVKLRDLARCDAANAAEAAEAQAAGGDTGTAGGADSGGPPWKKSRAK